jgi:hypothetical protein
MDFLKKFSKNPKYCSLAPIGAKILVAEFGQQDYFT